MKPLSTENIRRFFAGRPWLRPSDYPLFATGEIKPKRIRDLSLYILGYMAAKEGSTDRILEP